MPHLPTHPQVVYPTRDSGRQSTGRPPAAEPDPHLLMLLNQYRSAGVYFMAKALQDAGYTRPTPITTTTELAGLGPTDILSDATGALWSAASISDHDFQEHGPWTLERAARRATITTEGTTR